MSALSVSPPFNTFLDLNGESLEAGYIYIGTAGLNPVTNPIQAYWDAALTQPAPQPIRTVGGAPSRSGTPSALYIDAGDYSILVRNSNMSFVYSALTAAQRISADLITGIQASQVEYTPAGTGAVATTVEAEMQKKQLQVINVEDAPYYADGTGATDSTQAFADAMAYLVAAGGGTLELVGTSTYLLNGGALQPDGYKNGILIPFSQVNADPSEGITIEGNGARLLCGSSNMILIRNSRNCTTLRNMTLDSNGQTSVYLCLTGPEDMTQTTTLVGNSLATIDNVNRLGGPGVDGLVFMPGPNVGGADSGAFYHNIIGGYSNFIGGGRHVWARKNVDWATNPNWMTRSNFIGQRLTRGNAGYHFEDGAEITFQGCNEEAIVSGVTPLATPTARYFESPCSAMWFFGGYSEACSLAVFVDTNDVIESWGYKPASGSPANWNTYAQSWADGENENRAFTPVINSSGGGAEGSSSSFGRAIKQGKTVFITVQILVAKGTLAAGSLTISGLPFVGDPTWTSADFQGIPCTKMDGITLGAGNVALVGSIVGAGMLLRKINAAGTAMTNLALADCADPIIFTLQGWYKAA